MEKRNGKSIFKLGIVSFILFGLLFFSREPMLVMTALMIYGSYRMMDYGYKIKLFQEYKEKNSVTEKDEEKFWKDLREEYFILHEFLTNGFVKFVWVMIIISCLFGSAEIIMRTLLYFKSLGDFFSNLF